MFACARERTRSSFGKIYKAIHKDTNFLLAIKCIQVENPTPGELKQMYKEIEVLKKCRNPHIVSYFGSCIRQNDIWVRRIPPLLRRAFNVPDTSARCDRDRSCWSTAGSGRCRTR